MLFNSITYLLFLPAVGILFFAIPNRFRWAFLLFASYFFYACWRVEFLSLILVSTLVDYFVSRKMGALQTKSERKPWLMISLIVNLGLLFTFKYMSFLLGSLNDFFSFADWGAQVPVFDIILPVGISFYTFQTLSYTLDVYHGRLKPEKHLGIFALYVAFFPQLVAGPIERAGKLIPQFRAKAEVVYSRISSGLRKILFGLFKKVVIADTLADYVNLVYDQPENFPGLPIIMATVFFAFQIYCDFSGYTDIAIGSAEVLGIKLGRNFDRPYRSASFRQFWRRWHISLSTWFRDYVYIPLGGNRGGIWALSILATFALSGLWHGANFSFLIWGCAHGLLLILENAIRKDRPSLATGPGHYFSIFLVFSSVCFLWVFFRSPGIAFAFDMISDAWLLGSWSLSSLDIFQDGLTYGLSLFLVALLMLLEWRSGKAEIADWIGEKAVLVRWPAYYLLLFSILMVGINRVIPFIYFEF